MFPYLVCLHHKFSLLLTFRYLRLLGLSYCLTWHLFLSSAYQAHLTASCFASLFSFPFLLFSACLPSSYSSLTYLFSLLRSHFLYLSSWYFESAVCFFCVCFVHVHSHCFTMPRAMQVFCSSRSVSLETLFENSDVSFRHVLRGILHVFPFYFAPLLLSQPSLS